MKSKSIVFSLLISAFVLVNAPVILAQETDDEMGFGDEESAKDKARADGEVTAEGDAEVKAEGEATGAEAAAGKGVPINQLHAFLDLGYAIPVIGLTESKYSFDSSGHLFGGLPINFGAQYYVIDNLGVGARLRLTPMFWSPGEQRFGKDQDTDIAADGSMLFFDFQALVTYSFDFGLPFVIHPYVALGGTRIKKSYDVAGTNGEAAAMYFSTGIGALATYKLMKLGPGDLLLEGGLEFSMMFGGGDADHKMPKVVIYPLAPIVGARYTFSF